MKKIPALLLSLSLLGPNLAFADNNGQQQDAALAKLDAQTKALQQQIAALQAQVKQLQTSQPVALQPVVQSAAPPAHSMARRNPKAVRQLSRAQVAELQQAKKDNQAGKDFAKAPNNFSPDNNGDGPQFIRALRDRVSVITSPYLGLRSSYDASDLIINLPSMNEDLVLLKQRQDMEVQALHLGLPYGDQPLIMLSGDLLPQLIAGTNYEKQSTSQVALAGAEIDIQAISGRWASGFLGINYDNSTPSLGNVSNISNSRLYVSRGFVTIGNLNDAPVYVTAGQMYAPFGIYSNSLLTTPLTQAVGRTVIRSALLGYSEYGVYAEGYIFNGSAYTGSGNTIRDGGLNLGYKNHRGDWTYDAGVGVISSMADSQYAQSTGNTGTNQFAGFGQNTASEKLKSRVAGGDVHTEIRYKNWNMNAEYLSALQSYNEVNMTYNGSGASPSASHLELDNNQVIFNRPWTFALAYDHSWQALAYNIPEQSYFAVMSISIWKDTIESIEFRHDINYSSGSTARGALNGSTPALITPVGPTRNTVTMQLGFYF